MEELDKRKGDKETEEGKQNEKHEIMQPRWDEKVNKENNKTETMLDTNGKWKK